MQAATYHTSKVLSMEKLQAFVLFQKDGMTAVEQTYPEHVSFVLDHKAKTYREVKQELFGTY
jgi:hypothetical protein